MGYCLGFIGFKVYGAFGPFHKRLWVLARRPRALHSPVSTSIQPSVNRIRAIAAVQVCSTPAQDITRIYLY